ncbi:MAG TPA: hypothetical protein VGN17_29385 [Bryobacteraceae bacterium]|jgi:hypothetical protein
MSDSFCRIAATIRCGPVEDSYLTTEGAIAQAMNRNTILVHSSLFRMTGSSQFLILLHELAHLRQLAEPGNDSVRTLEEEAWEAAHSWASGRMYRVRGKARGRMNALVVIQGGDKGHPSAPPWYRSNPVEPIGKGSTITVKETAVIKDMTFEAVLDAIIKNKQSDVVIVCHGWAEGLALPLMAGGPTPGGAQKQQIFPLSADGNLKGEGGLKAPVRSDHDVAGQAHLSEAQVKTLRGKMNQIRGLGLNHVAFRSCDMGQDLDSLQAFRNFFGAKSVSAPKIFDSYGAFTPFIGAGVEAWAKTKRKSEGFRIAIDEGVAFGTKRTDSPLAYKILCKAPDSKTFTAWMKTHIADKAGTDGVVYHGMMDAGVANPEAPYIYFVRDGAFISNIVNYAGE